MSDARARILSRLANAPAGSIPAPVRPLPVPAMPDRLHRFRKALEAWRAEVHVVARADWPQRLRELLAAKGVRSLVYGARTDAGSVLTAAWQDKPSPALIPYDRPVESMKPVLLHEANAGLTETLGAIAETGSLILWPTPDEPRLLSLLPPVHVALVEADRIHESLADVIAAQGWAGRMPTNALLVSGPSKTADIEQTLAFGVHGPKELIVLVIQ